MMRDEKMGGVSMLYWELMMMYPSPRSEAMKLADDRADDAHGGDKS